MGVREDLVAAKALIDTPEKWWQGELSNEDETCFCAYGALTVATDDVEDEDAALRALRLALPADFHVRPNSKMDVAQFNDAPSTTHADIMALFDRAIAAAPVQS